MRVVQSFAREPRNQTSFAAQRALPRREHETVVLNGLYFPAVDLLVVARHRDRARLRRLPARSTARSRSASLVAFIAYLANFFDPIQQLSQLYTTFLSAMAALDKIFELLDEEPDVVDRAGARRAAADRRRGRFEDVRFGYGGAARGAARDRPRRPRRDDGRARRPHRRRQVDDREAPRALLRPARGPDHVDGHDLRDVDAGRRCAASSAIVPQEGFLFAGTVAREHRLRPARRDARGDRQAAARGRRGRLHRARSRTATTPSSASAASSSRSASASSSPSPARCSPTRAS